MKSKTDFFIFWNNEFWWHNLYTLRTCHSRLTPFTTDIKWFISLPAHNFKSISQWMDAILSAQLFDLHLVHFSKRHVSMPFIICHLCWISASSMHRGAHTRNHKHIHFFLPTYRENYLPRLDSHHHDLFLICVCIFVRCSPSTRDRFRILLHIRRG